MRKTKNIVVWGDSILKGIIQGSEGKQYQILDNNALKLASGTYNINITNHCYFGSTIAKGKSILERDINKGLTSDIGIIEFGGNDCDYKWDELCAAPNEHHDPKTPLTTFLSYLQTMINTLKNNNIKPVIMSLPPLVAPRYFKTISQNRDEKIIYNWLGDEEYLYRWHEMYSNEAAKLALNNDCYLLDVRQAFLAEHNYQRLICQDGIHPNETGHSFMYEFLSETLKKTGFAEPRTA